MRIPVIARTTYSPRHSGNNRVRPIETATSTMMAIRKRIATNEIGGRSRRPILMASHVELQTTHSVNQARGTPHPLLGRQRRFSLAISFFINVRPSRVGGD